MSKLATHLPRTLLKTLTYSVMHLTVAISVAYALTGNLAIALGIGLIEPAVQTIAYTLHEKAWQKVGCGQNEPVHLPLMTEARPGNPA